MRRINPVLPAFLKLQRISTATGVTAFVLLCALLSPHKSANASFVPLSSVSLNTPVTFDRDATAARGYQERLQNTTEAIWVGLLSAMSVGGGTYILWRGLIALKNQQTTSRFANPKEQLKHSNIDIRLRGIYALQRSAESSLEAQGKVIKLLASFARSRAMVNLNGEIRPLADDIQAALTLVGRRPIHADLEPDRFNFEAANFNQADLRHTNFCGSDFLGADLIKTDFFAADLGATFFFGANLSQSILTRANLYQADLRGTNLQRAILLGADLKEARLIGANLVGANLREADLYGADLSRANVERADFSGAYNLTTEQVKSAKGWHHAMYDNDFREQLGLPPESADKHQEH